MSVGESTKNLAFILGNTVLQLEQSFQFTLNQLWLDRYIDTFSVLTCFLIKHTQTTKNHDAPRTIRCFFYTFCFWSVISFAKDIQTQQYMYNVHSQHINI